MSPTASFFAALLLGALVAADALLQTEALARRARAAGAATRRLWTAHLAQLALLNVGFLLFAWTRLYFAAASLPSWPEFAVAGSVAIGTHALVDWTVRRAELAEALKVLGLVGAALALEFRHPEWKLMVQGPIVFLGQPVALQSFARNVTLLFGLSWAGLAWRRRPLALLRVLVVLALLAATL
jgi:hypothetical protein